MIVVSLKYEDVDLCKLNSIRNFKVVHHSILNHENLILSCILISQICIILEFLLRNLEQLRQCSVCDPQIKIGCRMSEHVAFGSAKYFLPIIFSPVC